MRKSIHLSVIGKAPAIKAVLNAEIDVFLRIAKTVKCAESAVRMETKELCRDSVAHVFLWGYT